MHIVHVCVVSGVYESPVGWGRSVQYISDVLGKVRDHYSGVPLIQTPLGPSTIVAGLSRCPLFRVIDIRWVWLITKIDNVMRLVTSYVRHMEATCTNRRLEVLAHLWRYS